MRPLAVPLFVSALLGAALPAAARTAASLQTPTARERLVAAAMQQAAAQPAQLRAFLQRMPKGGDLHNHGGGSVYAEVFMGWAERNGFCLDTTDFTLSPPPCAAGTVSTQGLAQGDRALYARAIDALSMRNFVAGAAAASGHDQFFATFDRFDPIDAVHTADSLVASLEQAARDRVGYVEIMLNPVQSEAASHLLDAAHWDADDYAQDLGRIDAPLAALVTQALTQTRALQRTVRQRMRCGSAAASPGCQVTYRLLAYVMRTSAPASVFGQMAFSYALAQPQDSPFVGVNIVAPEDDPVALRDYRTHMRMFAFLSARHPAVKLSLHAGELTLGLVPPAQLQFHIAAAVDAGAARIGHGVDLAYEDDPEALLARMRRQQVAVEINLTSNDQILGIRGGAHPLHLYLEAGVPVVLSTDDEGVARSDMTHEYLRAVLEQQLDYPTLKQIARNGVSYGFLPGQSLWTADAAPVAACRDALQAATPPEHPHGACARLLAGSAKARQQWALERAFAAFEYAITQAPASARLSPPTRATTAPAPLSLARHSRTSIARTDEALPRDRPPTPSFP
jgi:adenosine deaminase